MKPSQLPKREHDDFGEGHFKAGRGKRKHQGQDYIAFPGMPIHAQTAGKVERVGYPYKNDFVYRLIVVKDIAGKHWRYMYVHPVVHKGDVVTEGMLLGYAQDVAKKYITNDRYMFNHLHLDIKHNGEFIDPVSVVA
jgi:murein DD-endopeptidase MepM/ murein hydrolase activator NlpD